MGRCNKKHLYIRKHGEFCAIGMNINKPDRIEMYRHKEYTNLEYTEAYRKVKELQKRYKIDTKKTPEEYLITDKDILNWDYVGYIKEDNI